MPLETSLAHIEERNKQYGGAAYVCLLEIVLPTGVTLRLARNNDDVSWEGETWQKFNFELDDVDESTNAEARKLTIKVGNATRAILRYVEELDVWRKINGNISCALRLLMVSTGVAEAEGPVGEWYFDDRGISAPKPGDWVFFKVGGESFLTRQVPRRAIVRDFCGWESTVDCPYVATCARTLAACEANGRLEKNGGFPMVEQGAIHG